MKRISNPPNPFHSTVLEWDGPAPELELKIFEDASRSILSRNSSPDLPFTWSINPYRGCMHACAYCYARPTHQYLDLGAGTDFDRTIVIKRRAADLLRSRFMKRSWAGEMILFSGNTDCYQPLEARYGLTRECLQVCREFRNPVAIVTKSALIERDIDLLRDLTRDAACFVTLSVPFWDPADCRQVEPWAPRPDRRIKAMRRLHEAGIPVGVNVAPIIPGLNDSSIPAILEAAADAGAQRASRIMVRLPGPVSAIFEERIRAAFPLEAEKILHRIEDARGGARSDSRFGDRMRGQGSYWQAIETLFETTCARLGLDAGGTGTESAAPQSTESTFRRPGEGAQLNLFTAPGPTRGVALPPP